MKTINKKTDKELAFLQDLFIAPDWGERFAELIDEHVKLPDEGKALYAAAGTGGHAMALQERAGKKLEMLCVDENAECLELAQAKASATSEDIRFSHGHLDSLALPDNEFDLVTRR
jgi:ubiquinone/menaquinone biosynthesis C-methylase UbiE